MLELLATLEAAQKAMAMARSAYEVFEVSKEAISSQDRARVEATLATLQEEHDALYNTVQSKLRGT